MRTMAGDKVKDIINKEYDARVAMTVITYIIDKGWNYVSQITEEEILEVKGNAFMTDEFVQALVRTAVKICKETSQIDDFLPYIINHLYVPNAKTGLLDFYKDETTDENWEMMMDVFDIDEEEYDKEITMITLNANVVEIV